MVRTAGIATARKMTPTTTAQVLRNRPRRQPPCLRARRRKPVSRLAGTLPFDGQDATRRKQRLRRDHGDRARRLRHGGDLRIRRCAGSSEPRGFLPANSRRAQSCAAADPCGGRPSRGGRSWPSTRRRQEQHDALAVGQNCFSSLSIAASSFERRIGRLVGGVDDDRYRPEPLPPLPRSAGARAAEASREDPRGPRSSGASSRSSYQNTHWRPSEAK
jgi:hypothetical protein